MSRAAYLADLAAAIDKAREIADLLDLDDTGYGDGYCLFTAGRAETFGYSNTSDLLSDLGAEIADAAARAATAAAA